MQRFKESAMQFFTLIEELKTRGDIKVEAAVLEYVFDTDDCDLYFIMPDKRVINLTKNKK